MSRFRFVVTLMLLTSLLALVVGSAQAQESTPSPDDQTIGVRGLLESGQPIQDAFEKDTTAYVYGFSGSAGDSVTISMDQAQGSELDPFLVLLGPKGEVIASDDDSGTDVLNAALISHASLPDDGVYLVMATTFAHVNEVLVETGIETEEPTDESFTLTVTGNHAPTTTTEDNSTILIHHIDKGDTLDGQSTGDEPVGYFTYAGKAGDKVSFIASSDDFDTIVHVFDPDGDRVAVNDDDPQGGTSDSAIRDFTLPEDGVYLIFVTNTYFFNADNTNATPQFEGGDYTFSVQ